MDEAVPEEPTVCWSLAKATFSFNDECRVEIVAHARGPLLGDFRQAQQSRVQTLDRAASCLYHTLLTSCAPTSTPYHAATPAVTRSHLLAPSAAPPVLAARAIAAVCLRRHLTIVLVVHP
eukprot:COSAG02_NODE_4925_length_4831_cov_2.178149_4_plen_120_part_00